MTMSSQSHWRADSRRAQTKAITVPRKGKITVKEVDPRQKDNCLCTSAIESHVVKLAVLSLYTVILRFQLVTTALVTQPLTLFVSFMVS